MKNNLILEYNNSFGLKMNNIFFNCLSHLTTFVPSHSFGCALSFAKMQSEVSQFSEQKAYRELSRYLRVLEQVVLSRSSKKYVVFKMTLIFWFPKVIVQLPTGLGFLGLSKSVIHPAQSISSMGDDQSRDKGLSLFNLLLSFYVS